MFAQEPPPDFDISCRREPGKLPELVAEMVSYMRLLKGSVLRIWKARKEGILAFYRQVRTKVNFTDLNRRSQQSRATYKTILLQSVEARPEGYDTRHSGYNGLGFNERRSMRGWTATAEL